MTKRLGLFLRKRNPFAEQPATFANLNLTIALLDRRIYFIFDKSRLLHLFVLNSDFSLIPRHPSYTILVTRYLT